jgi:hypothetical protein
MKIPLQKKKKYNHWIKPQMDQHPRGSRQKTYITTQPQLKLDKGITKYAFQFYDKSIT